ncbi:MAG: TetR/AcrR family transcriptional regulator [Actinomycetota bacterium]|nr:TetR/AcrR family transcriptional regulator [Actinomycetota bacterium]
MQQPSTPSGERGRRRSERSHQAIVAATRELLVERGYPDVTIEAIAARARVGKQTIYRWWPSRAALVLEAYLSSADVVQAPAPGRTVREDVRALLGWLIAVLREPTGGHVVAGLVGDIQHDAVLAEGFHRDVVPARREAMLAALGRGQERGEIRADTDLKLAIDTLHGAVFYRLLLSGESLDDTFTRRLSDQVLAGIST